MNSLRAACSLAGAVMRESASSDDGPSSRRRPEAVHWISHELAAAGS